MQRAEAGEHTPEQTPASQAYVHGVPVAHEPVESHHWGVLPEQRWEPLVHAAMLSAALSSVAASAAPSLPVCPAPLDPVLISIVPELLPEASLGWLLASPGVVPEASRPLTPGVVADRLPEEEVVVASDSAGAGDPTVLVRPPQWVASPEETPRTASAMDR
jgi:hypothetical protein